MKRGRPLRSPCVLPMVTQLRGGRAGLLSPEALPSQSPRPPWDFALISEWLQFSWGWWLGRLCPPERLHLALLPPVLPNFCTTGPSTARLLSSVCHAYICTDQADATKWAPPDSIGIWASPQDTLTPASRFLAPCEGIPTFSDPSLGCLASCSSSLGSQCSTGSELV